jgi:hypothetical protein
VANNYRAKGHTFQHETADLWREHGHHVSQLQRNLADTGDNMIRTPHGVTLAEETKRRERLSIPEWWKQTCKDAPDGSVPVLTFRQSRRESLTVIRTADLARLLAGQR